MLKIEPVQPPREASALKWEIAGCPCPKCGSDATNFASASDDSQGWPVELLECLMCRNRWWTLPDD